MKKKSTHDFQLINKENYKSQQLKRPLVRFHTHHTSPL